MTPFLSALLTSLVFFAPTVDSSDLRKCGGMQFPGVENGELLVAMDDRVVSKAEYESESFRALIRETGIDYVDMTCWDPDTGRFGVDSAGAYRLILLITAPNSSEVAPRLEFTASSSEWEATMENGWVRCAVGHDSPSDEGAHSTRPTCVTTNPRLSAALRDYLAAHDGGDAPAAGGDR